MKPIHLAVLTAMAIGLFSQAHAQCSNASLNGTYFFTFGGSIKSGATTVSNDELGKVTADGNGNFTGTTTTSIAGALVTLPVTGSYTIHADCSGTATLITTANTVNFALQVVNGGGLTLASITSSTAGEISEGRFYRAANFNGAVCSTGTLSGTYGVLLNGGTYVAGVRTAFNGANQTVFDGNGGVTVTGETTAGGSTSTAFSGTGTYSISSDCSGTAQVTSSNGTVNYDLARVEGGTILFLESDGNTTVAGTASPSQIQDIVPQIAFGGGWYTALYFTNTTASTVSFDLNFIADNGTALNVPGVGTTKHIALAPQATTVIEMLNTGTTVNQGYATFSVPTGIAGYAVFRQSVPGIADQEGLTAFKTAAATSTAFTWDETGSAQTSLAIANPSSVPVTVTITAWDNSGNLAGTATIPLAAGAKTASIMRTIAGLSGIVGLRGSALVTVSTGNVSVLALRFDGAAFTSIPTTQE